MYQRLIPNKIRKYFWEVINSVPTFSLWNMINIAKFTFDQLKFAKFKFIKKIIDYCASEGIKTIAFINEEAHEEMAKASFEGLFTNIAKMSNNRLEVVK